MSNIVAFNRHKLYRVEAVAAYERLRKAGCNAAEAVACIDAPEREWQESGWQRLVNGTRRLQALFGIAFCLFVVGLVVGWVS
jgi:hypothetical protein